MSEVYSKTTTSKNPSLMYNGGLRSKNIKYIVIHHNATTNKYVAMNTWKVGSNAWTSAHYEVTPTEIIGCIGENYIAYHAGGTGGADVPKIADPNGVSIGIEHVNSTGAPQWGVADDTLRMSAKLVADICKRYGLPIDRNTIKKHSEVTATACPGGLDIDKLVRYAQEEAKKGENQMAQPKFKREDLIKLKSTATHSAYGTPIDNGTKSTWGKIIESYPMQKSNSQFAYTIAFWYKNSIVFWHILEQDLQSK